MAYKRKTWKNDSSTPLNADGLNDFDKRVGDEFDAIKDYVVEEYPGYERWKSGKIVQYGSTTVNWETSKALGTTGWFYGSEITIRYPKAFKENPEFYFEIIVGNTIVVPQTRYATAGSFIFIMVSPIQYTDLRNDKLHWRAIGK